MAKPKLIHVRIENSCYGSSFIWTSTGTDGSQNYLEHCKYSILEYGSVNKTSCVQVGTKAVSHRKGIKQGHVNKT